MKAPKQLLADLKKLGATAGPSMAEQIAEGKINDLPASEWVKAGKEVARGNVRHEPGRMNKLETDYSRHLDSRKQRGEIFGYFFESFKLRLADKTWYTPDFLVILADGTLEFHETKGFRRDDAMVKIKVAAEQYPVFAFLLVEQAQGAWAMSRFNSGV